MKTSKSLIVLVFFVCGAAFSVSSQPAPVKIGENAPGLKLTQVLGIDEHESLSLEDLKGQVVVLEFWATWCSPCIPAMDHLNKVVESFEGQPVKFIAITSESEDRVKGFLSKRPFGGVIGLDELDETRKAYNFVGFPHTVVIDKNGKIAAITNPKEITESVIRDLLDGKEISLPVKGVIPPDLNWDKELIDDDTLFQAVIKLSISNRGGVRTLSNSLTFDGIALIDLLRKGFRVSPRGAVYNIDKFELMEQKYRASIFVPKGKEDLLYPTFQKLLVDSFDIKVRTEKREADVFVLKIKDKRATLKSSSGSEKGLSFGKGIIEGRRQTIFDLSKALENFVQKPVVDETGLNGEYNWTLAYNFGDRSILLSDLDKKLGLELVEAKRNIEFTIFEKKPVQ